MPPLLFPREPARSSRPPGERAPRQPVAPAHISSVSLSESDLADGARHHHEARASAPARDALDDTIDAAYRSLLERRLAFARLAASIVLVGAMAVGSDAYHSPRVTALMAAYVAYSVVVLAIQWRYVMASPRAGRAWHVIDFAWATLATAQSGGTSSHTFLLFLLVIAAAAYRWSLRGSLVTAAGVLVVACAEALAAAYGWVTWPFEFDTFVLLPLTVVVFAVLFGLLAERLHTLGEQAIALGEILRHLEDARSTAAAVPETLQRIVRLFGAREALVVVHEHDRARAVLWEARHSPAAGVTVTRSELGPDERAALLFAVPSAGNTFELQRQSNAGGVAAHLLGAGGQLERVELRLARDLPRLSGWRSVTFTVTDVPDCWAGRVFLIDASRPPGMLLRLANFQRLVRQLNPAFAGLYLTSRLRSRAEARERARLARELHDGVVQTLAAIDMRIEMASRRVQAVDPPLWHELRQTRDLLRADIMNLRELMEHVRPVDVDPDRLPGELSDLAERFSRISGIRASLICAAPSTELTRRQCAEVLRIVQEALANVRRHSKASQVTIRITADASGWELIVEDNGAGFGFVGRRTHDQLRDQREGPRVIRERVESLGGSLDIESSAQGARLEILFPRRHVDA